MDGSQTKSSYVLLTFLIGGQMLATTNQVICLKEVKRKLGEMTEICVRDVVKSCGFEQRNFSRDKMVFNVQN